MFCCTSYRQFNWCVQYRCICEYLCAKQHISILVFDWYTEVHFKRREHLAQQWHTNPGLTHIRTNKCFFVHISDRNSKTERNRLEIVTKWNRRKHTEIVVSNWNEKKNDDRYEKGIRLIRTREQWRWRWQTPVGTHFQLDNYYFWFFSFPLRLPYYDL